MGVSGHLEDNDHHIDLEGYGQSLKTMQYVLLGYKELDIMEESR